MLMSTREFTQRHATGSRGALVGVRSLANHAFSRAAGAPLIGGNHIRLLKDACENYPAWLDAIKDAQHHIYFESYIIHDDSTGNRFADALIAKAQEGVVVRLIYDWMGAFGKASGEFWQRLHDGGVEVRCYNPPRIGSPLGWLSRDHRKMLSVDGQTGFISGLCVGRMWEGVPEKNLEPWRDTGVEIRGLAVREIEDAFAQVWALTGEPIPETERACMDALAPVGDMSMRVVASMPATASMFRLDQLIAAMARERLWITDAYFAGTSIYMQALMVAAKDGVDVRLIVPGASDIPLLKLLSSAGYRPLLSAGVRVFEWNGLMLHAKTAVADGHWARVGSTNLNVASWFGNCELDAVVEDETFARQMEDMYIQDLENCTEIVLSAKRRRRPLGRLRRPQHLGGGRGRIGRAAGGAVRIGNAIGAAFTDRRVLAPVEAKLMLAGGVISICFATLIAIFPNVLAYPLSIILVWVGLALAYKSFRLFQEGRRTRRNPSPPMLSPNSPEPTAPE